MDHCAAARALSQRLRSEGAADLGERIEETILAGSTGTEIFMGLRHHLRRALARTAEDDTRRDIRQLLSEIDRALS